MSTVYIGKVEGQDVSVNGLGYDVVMKLMQPFLNQGYKDFKDFDQTSNGISLHLSPQCLKLILNRGMEILCFCQVGKSTK